MAKLVVLSEGLTGRTCELKSEKTTIGRLEDNAFQIAEPSVSSHHCEIVLQGNDVVVRDLNSTNGTFISGERVTETVLKPGQILRLGQVELRLEVGAPVPSGKIPLDKTRVMPQGVKFDLEEGHKPVFEKDSPFAKKSNKTAKVFIAVGVLLGLIIIAALVWALSNIGG
ncbi:MAG: FHA domain-containing protein [Verrucomicrobia bacterium]|nr:FHA domain-containing protein [Verrucomicrobiota bacterium]